MDQSDAVTVVDRESLAKRPGHLLIGFSGVGKRTLLSLTYLHVAGLLSLKFEDDFDSSSGHSCLWWTINTKYYTGDVAMWMAYLYNFSITGVPMFDQVAALVMVFDLINVSLSYVRPCNSTLKFPSHDHDRNKADLFPGHLAHVEYRRRLLNLDKSAESDISETEGSSLLGDEESSSLDIKRSCMEWCSEHNIEYIEACASNPRFDKCLSVAGDSQGVQRLLGALSAHMWPGMVLKSGDTINQPSLPKQEAGSVEPWDDTDVAWVSATDDPPPTNNTEPVEEICRSQSHSQAPEEIEIKREQAMPGSLVADELNDEGGKIFELEDMEQLMSEIGSMRDSLRLMPDFQRREMAANLAMKMASMFGDSSGDEGKIEHLVWP